MFGSAHSFRIRRLSCLKKKLFSRLFSNTANRFKVDQRGSLWTKYNDLIKKHPLATKSITGGIIAFSADIICQIGFKDKKTSEADKSSNAVVDALAEVDWSRATKFTVISIFFISPCLHYWYGFLGRTIHGNNMMATLQRLTLDQLFFAPAIIPAIFSIALLLEGKPEEIIPKLKASWFSTVLANYAVWVPAQFINFKFTPPHLQVLFSNSVGFFWNIYLSYSTYDSAGAHATRVTKSMKSGDRSSNIDSRNMRDTSSSSAEYDMSSASLMDSDTVKKVHIIETNAWSIMETDGQIQSLQEQLDRQLKGVSQQRDRMKALVAEEGKEGRDGAKYEPHTREWGETETSRKNTMDEIYAGIDVSIPSSAKQRIHSLSDYTHRLLTDKQTVLHRLQSSLDRLEENERLLHLQCVVKEGWMLVSLKEREQRERDKEAQSMVEMEEAEEKARLIVAAELKAQAEIERLSITKEGKEEGKVEGERQGKRGLESLRESNVVSDDAYIELDGSNDREIGATRGTDSDTAM